MKIKLPKINKINKLTFVFFLIFFCCLFFIFCLDWVIKASTKTYIFPSHTALSGTKGEVVMILGAKVYANGKMSDMLYDRAWTAVQIYKKGNADAILISADNARTGYNEVEPIKDYLLSEDIPAEKIFLDYAGFDTYDSMYRAKEVFGVKKVLISSQGFHLPRVVRIARHIGIDAQGVVADQQPYISTRLSMIREIFANIKAWGSVSFGIKPKFLGKKIPITGTGNALSGL